MFSKDTAYQGASKTSPQLKDWYAKSQSADRDLVSELETITSRARDLDRNDGLAQGARVTSNDNVIGTGLTLSPKPNYRKLDKDLKWADQWARKVKAEWIDYSESTFFDADGEMNFAQATQLQYNTNYVNGAAIAIPLWLKRKNTPFRTCFKIIDPDRLCNPDTKPDNLLMRGGVERNANGQIVAYHIRDRHPSDDGTFPVNFRRWKRIAAYGPDGRQRFIHICGKERPGQSRGKARATAVLAAFGMRGHYQLTELQAAIVNSKIAGILESDLSPEEAQEIFGITSDEIQKMHNEWNGKLSAGAILSTPIGTKFNSHIPNRPQSAYSDYMKVIGREIGTALSLPIELFARDFSDTNYSAARVALLEAWRHFNVERSLFSTQWASACYRLWMQEAVALGLIDAPNYMSFQSAYTRANWLALGFQPVDEFKAARSVTERLKNGTTTYEREYAQMGLDAYEEIEAIYREKAFHKEMAEKYGVDPIQYEESNTIESPESD